MRRNMMMKKVAGFHSFDLGFFEAAEGEGFFRKAFGISETQKEG
jgi:hypothetical protein